MDLDVVASPQKPRFQVAPQSLLAILSTEPPATEEAQLREFQACPPVVTKFFIGAATLNKNIVQSDAGFLDRSKTLLSHSADPE